MVCALFDFLFTFNIYKFEQSLTFVDFTNSDILIHIKMQRATISVAAILFFPPFFIFYFYLFIF